MSISHIPLSMRMGGLALAILTSSCVQIPQDELDRMEKIQQNWEKTLSFEEGRAYSVEEIRHAAVHRQPGLTAAFRRYQAALQQIILDGSLADPRVQAGYFLESVQTRSGPQNWKLGVSQSFPFFGKRDLRAEIALHDAQALREELMDLRLRVARDASAACYEILFLENSLSITERQTNLISQLSASVESRFLTGKSSRSDVLGVQMVLDRLKTESELLEHRRLDAQARLNALLDRPPASVIRITAQSSPVALSQTLDQNILVQDAQGFGPVRVQAHRVLRQESAVALADLGYYPDFSLGYDYISVSRIGGSMASSDDGKDPQILGISFSLPIYWWKNDARLDRAKHLLEAERASRQDILRRAEQKILSAIEQTLEQEKSQALIADRLLPQAEQRLRLSEGDYLGGRADFDRLIDAEREILDLELQLERTIRSRLTLLAEVDYLTGGSLGMLIPIPENDAEAQNSETVAVEETR